MLTYSGAHDEARFQEKYRKSHGKRTRNRFSQVTPTEEPPTFPGGGSLDEEVHVRKRKKIGDRYVDAED